ncbi:MAG: DUF4115 domain-containing protein [Clostridia bacterium]|nr:DUF4115 domain-containing protein [Clostridia bacterium]
MEEIARRLRERREALGLTLAQAQAATRIRTRYLAALEAGDLAAIPGMVYVRGYLRAYAEFLGLDPTTLIEDFERAMGGPGAAAPEAAGPGAAGPGRSAPGAVGRPPSRERGRRPAAQGGRGERPAREYGLAGPEPLRPPRRGSGWFVLAALAVAAALWYWFGTAHAGRTPGAGPPASEVGAAPSEAAPSEPTPPSEAPPSEAARPPTVTRAVAQDGTIVFTVAGADEVLATLTFTGDCWVEGRADGASLGPGVTHHEGESLTWRAAHRLEFVAGYAPALHLSIAGIDQGPLDTAPVVRRVAIELQPASH